ncbi:CaiB/BaiF CoA-transferase family protein [Desulfoluna sp.]|uniref:CaiB/BaiF CoA transferase family protein n=1 Tax=Desulfoluna sp. TaxID=2045199 RepID=UPI002618514D|nr:CaiB/BaiF CoA-transferase family protein [Desulfoluna sp.]
METQGSLSGIKVLDLSRLLPGPFCSMILADHGARVISIEDKRFEAEGAFPTIVNRNKQHMTLNLKSDAGREIFYTLLEDADVVIEGFRPGVTAKLGVDYDTLKEKKPGIIYCSITGYGQTGPYRDRPGHDVNYIGVAGLLDLVGPRDGAPTIPGFQVADVAGGSMNAVTGILMALFERTNTGLGQYIDISLADCCIPFHAINLNIQQQSGDEPERSNTVLSHGYPFYSTYETKDGKYVSLGALEPRFWGALCDYLGVPQYAAHQLNAEKIDEITECLTTTFKSKTLSEWEKDMGDLPNCWGPINTMADAMASELFIERGMSLNITDKNGKTSKTFGTPIKLSRTPGSIRTPPDSFGESTRSILTELGFSQQKIASYFDYGII